MPEFLTFVVACPFFGAILFPIFVWSAGLALSGPKKSWVYFVVYVLGVFVALGLGTVMVWMPTVDGLYGNYSPFEQISGMPHIFVIGSLYVYFRFIREKPDPKGGQAELVEA